MLQSCSEVGAGTARFGVSIAAEMVMVREEPGREKCQNIG